MSVGELRFELDDSKPDPEEVAKLLVEAREARRLEGLGDGGAEALANAMIGCGSKHTPLTLSLSKGAIGVTKVLLDHGADPNLRNADNKLPLSIAIRKRDEASLSLLIRNGANVFASVNETSWTPQVFGGCCVHNDRGCRANATNSFASTVFILPLPRVFSQAARLLFDLFSRVRP